MKVLMISANTSRTPYPVYPLGMSMVAAAVSGAGHDVTCFDFLQSNLSFDALRDAVRKVEPEVVGISIRNIDNVNLLNEQRYVEIVRDVADCVRRESRAGIVLGGSAFSIMPERMLSAVGGDYGIVGEGEALFVRFLADVSQGRYPPRGTILRDGDLLPGEAIPSAQYSPEMLAHYLQSGSVAPVQTKRGCPLNCVYCSYPALEGREIRPRNPACVIDDIETLVNEHGARFIFFTDSLFNDGGGAFRKVLREMADRGVSVPWSAFFSPAGITPDDVELMKRTGLRAVEMGSDAACDATLRGQRKLFTWHDVETTNDLFAKAGVSTAHYFMFGGPEETRATALEGIENIRNLKCSAVFVFMGIRILPDTELYEIALRENLVTASQDLLVPYYYLSPAVDRNWLEKTLTDAFRPLRHVVFPPDALDDKLQLLHKLGYTGSLWELLAPSSK